MPIMRQPVHTNCHSVAAALAQTELHTGRAYALGDGPRLPQADSLLCVCCLCPGVRLHDDFEGSSHQGVSWLWWWPRHN